MKWASKYDKDTIKELYLADSTTGRGQSANTSHTNGFSKSEDTLTPTKPPFPAPPSSTKPPAVPPKAAAPPPPALDEDYVMVSEKDALADPHKTLTR